MTEKITKKPVVKNVDGNAFAIIGAAQRAMRNAGIPKETIDEMRTRAMAGDYNNLLCVVQEYVEFKF